MSDQPNDRPQAASSPARKYVRIGLLVVLVLLALALAQDRLVARPAVQDAVAEVTELNNTHNSSKDTRPTTHLDVQSVLGRKPTRVLPYGPDKVEEYAWMAGLPGRSHKYYAVYEQGKDGETLYLKTHYSFTLPAYDEEPERRTVDTSPPPGNPVAGSVSGGRQRPAGDDEDSDPDGGGAAADSDPDGAAAEEEGGKPAEDGTEGDKDDE